MKVYKFGGASVKNGAGVRNLRKIISAETGSLIVIISAIGKTTNALESVVNKSINGDIAGACSELQKCEDYHLQIAEELFGHEKIPASVVHLLSELRSRIENHNCLVNIDYNKWYDTIVSYGELLSTTIISEYLNEEGIGNTLLDMRRVFITDQRHRDANIDLDVSSSIFASELKKSKSNIFIGQGFIGGTVEGETTTLGREGSDYSAAVAGFLTDAESVTIWKDVKGVLSADPKFFPDAEYIPELTYLDAIELAYSGAQIIHPKTIKPLQNKDIPLFVRPFTDPDAPGTVIKKEIKDEITIPITILKKKQVLLSIRPNDFSFVLENQFSSIFSLLEKFNVKMNLIQSSAINLSLCIDHSDKVSQILEALKKDNYRAVFNDNLELLTIRGYNKELLERYTENRDIFITQKTRRIVRIVRKENKMC